MKTSLTVLAALLSAALAPGAAAQGAGPTTTLVSPGDADSFGCDVSRSGRAVAFASSATNLAPRDTNDRDDVFLARGGEIERVSVTTGEKQSVVQTGQPSISADGTTVAFLASGYRLKTRSRLDTIFVRDVAAGVTSRVSTSVSEGRPDGPSWTPAVSGNGRRVGFSSFATDLVHRSRKDGSLDVYVRGAGGEVEQVTVDDGEGRVDTSWEVDLSRSGRFVAFSSDSTALVRDDTNDSFDVFRHDRATGRTIRVSVRSDGTEGAGTSERPSISPDGRYVAFVSSAALTDEAGRAMHVYVHDVLTGVTELVSTGPAGPANAFSDDPTVSDDGRYVAFLSAGDNLVPGDTNRIHDGIGLDGFVRDRVEGETTRVTVGEDGEQANSGALQLRLSPDGGYVCWTTRANNLVSADHAGQNVFLRGPLQED